ncbi:restriction endonuclease subunit S [Bifidobacterium bifidum]|uniref:restriction endonuclease subunit S n=1 Tax=Bifidobacterium bifidum TaxID=1681 RepID=UPI000658E2FA|nr:type I restriction-modification system, subunit S [Bifidobacterium bifidum]
MTEQAKVPAIRFAGFTDPWEQRKASEVFQIVDDRGHPTLPVLSATQNQGMIYRDDSGRYIGHDESNEIGYKRVLPGDFVVHLRSFQGGFAHSQYEGITSPAYTVFRAKEPTSHSDRFWKHWFMSEHFIAGLSTVTYGIRDGRSISVDEFMNTFLAFPAVEEQAAISRLLDYLDSLITLHQRKYDKLVVFKKSMLEKMFPKDGESVPEIRFAGFTDPWEQRKLGELVVIERGGSPRPIDEYITDDTNGLNWVKIGDAPSLGRYISKTSEKIKPEGLSKTRQVHPGDLILSNSMSFGRPYIMAIEGCIHDGWLLIRDEPKSFDPMYLCHMLGTPKMLNQYRMLASGSTVNNLNKELVSNASILMPCKSEQKVIGQFFNHLDDLITLHQRKLELLRNIKKSLLDKMFV